MIPEPLLNFGHWSKPFISGFAKVESTTNFARSLSESLGRVGGVTDSQ